MFRVREHEEHRLVLRHVGPIHHARGDLHRCARDLGDHFLAAQPHLHGRQLRLRVQQWPRMGSISERGALVGADAAGLPQPPNSAPASSRTVKFPKTSSLNLARSNWVNQFFQPHLQTATSLIAAQCRAQMGRVYICFQRGFGSNGLSSAHNRPLSISRVGPKKTASASCVPRFAVATGVSVSGSNTST